MKPMWPNLLLSLHVLVLSGVASGMKIVKDHRPLAVIVTPDKPFPVVQRAAQELQYHVRKATGAELAIVPEGQALDPPPRRIYLGDCRATRNAGIETDKLATSGFVIRLMGN